MSVVAIDWSGRASGERRHLWTAEADAGELVRLEAGRTRAEVVDELVARVDDADGVVVGFDFSFSLPAWFLRARGYADARALLMDNAKLIRDSASDYKRLFTLVKAKLAKERGFTL